jgi:hypothetical protein
MYDAARSVVDAMRHRSRIGPYLRRSGRDAVSQLPYFARELGALSVIRPSVEAVLA